MIKTINYLNYLQLPEDTKLENKITTLLNTNIELVSKMPTIEVLRIIQDLNNIQYNSIPAHLQLPSNYNKITFGDWADIEEFEKMDTPDSILYEIAVLFCDSNRTIEDIKEKVKELGELNIEIGLPIIYWHIEKKKNLGKDFRIFTIKKLKTIQKVINQEKMKLDNNGDGMQLQVHWLLRPWKWTLSLMNQFRKYLLMFRLKISLAKLQK